MLLFYFKLVIVVALISVGIAILISRQFNKEKRVNKEKRDKYCPYCCCREHCRIGQNVEQKCSDRELKPFVCGGIF